MGVANGLRDFGVLGSEIFQLLPSSYFARTSPPLFRHYRVQAC